MKHVANTVHHIQAQDIIVCNPETEYDCLPAHLELWTEIGHWQVSNSKTKMNQNLEVFVRKLNQVASSYTQRK